MSRVVLALVLSLWLLPTPARALEKRLAVLELLDEGAALSPFELSALTNDVRAAALVLQPSGYIVMTRESMLAMLGPDGADVVRRCTGASCEVEAGRTLGADLVVAGTVGKFAGDLEVLLKLFDTSSASLLAQRKAQGGDLKTLRKALEVEAPILFSAVGGGFTAAAPTVAPPGPGRVPPPPVAAASAGPRVSSGGVTAAVGDLTIDAKPREGVRLDVTDPAGATTASGVPYKNAAAAPGAWRVTASATGCEAVEQAFTVPADEVTVVRLEVKPLGSLQVDGSPAGAKVEVTGPAGFANTGGLPWAAEGLPSGAYHVKVTRPGYGTFAEDRAVSAGEATVVPVALVKEGVAGDAANGPATSRGAGLVTIPVELYVMSKCPYGSAVVQTFAEVFQDIGANIDLKLAYIGDDLGNGQLQSMHGDEEVQGDLLAVCAQELGDTRRFLTFASCLAKNHMEIPKGWEDCASVAGYSRTMLATCYRGSEGRKLLAESMKIARDKKATGSPTIYVGGELYAGGREKVDFLRAICDKLAIQPQICSTLPEPVKFDITIISDTRCTECAASVERMEGQLKAMFSGLTITRLDYGDRDGRVLYDRTRVKYLPAFLFDPVVENDPGYDRLKRWMSPVGDYLLLNVGSKFDPTAEVCDNGIDDTGNGRIDCTDETCKGTLACRARIARKLELFIMSGCPFGIKALNSLKEIVEAFKHDGVTFQVHYIATRNDDGSFQSLHGDWEADEDIRELCAFKLGGTQKALEYIWCRNPNIQDASGWRGCATKARIDVVGMGRCATGKQGSRLLSDDIAIANTLGISASPTWLANNKVTFKGLDAESIRAGLCGENPGLHGCRKTLSTEAK